MFPLSCAMRDDTVFAIDDDGGGQGRADLCGSHRHEPAKKDGASVRFFTD